MNYPDIELYVDGRWKRASGVPVINPACCKSVRHYRSRLLMDDGDYR